MPRGSEVSKEAIILVLNPNFLRGACNSDPARQLGGALQGDTPIIDYVCL
jgi:hypothetical protein